MKLYAHPFSSYCQKVLIALYENAVPFEFCQLGPDAAQIGAEFAALWPLQKMPVLFDDGQAVMEATIIIEYLGLRHPGPVQLIPADPRAALEARFLDRVYDNYVMTPMQRIVANSLRGEADRNEFNVTEAKSLLDRAYRWCNDQMQGREWALGDVFSLADCAAAPSLFYADWAHPIDAEFTALRAYRQRLLARPSMVRAVDEARPYRSFFPLGAPDRD
jgi:glutathione S-transferase